MSYFAKLEFLPYSSPLNDDEDTPSQEFNSKMLRHLDAINYNYLTLVCFYLTLSLSFLALASAIHLKDRQKVIGTIRPNRCNDCAKLANISPAASLHCTVGGFAVDPIFLQHSLSFCLSIAGWWFCLSCISFYLCNFAQLHNRRGDSRPASQPASSSIDK